MCDTQICFQILGCVCICMLCLHNLHGTQGAALVVSHDRFFLREFATRVLEIADGKLKDYDSWDAYQANRRVYNAGI